jgi:hypothetical protein
MLYRADNGHIYVLVNDGRFFLFTPAQYAGLRDNPVRRTTPPNRFRPAFGFGKVWGNNWYVRAAIGWAVIPETGYVATLQQADVNTLLMSLPDNRRIRFWSPGGTWSFEDGTLPPLRAVTASDDGPDAQPTPTDILPTPPPFLTAVPTTTPQPLPNPIIQMGAAFQQFQNGFMIWRQDTREIWVFYGGTVGVISRFAPGEYEGWPDNPVTELPPAGLSAPVAGFGRVWGNRPDVRNALGWGVAPELPYTLTLELIGLSSEGQIYKLTLPTGASVTINGNNWNL